MTTNGTNYLENEIDKVIRYCRREFDITYAEVVGVLHIAAMRIAKETLVLDDEDEEEEEIV